MVTDFLYAVQHRYIFGLDGQNTYLAVSISVVPVLIDQVGKSYHRRKQGSIKA